MIKLPYDEFVTIYDHNIFRKRCVSSHGNRSLILGDPATAASYQ